MKRIIVIEDNTEVRENLKEILELDGYEVFTAENGMLGVEQVRKHIPDLILCDVMMPKLDGFGVLNILNRSLDINHIPLIFLTAKAEKEDFRRGMGLGAEDYITKPFDDVELLNTIELRLKKAERIQNTINNSPQGIQNFFSESKALLALDQILENNEIRTLQAKDKIYEVDQIPRWLYYLKTGQVKILIQNRFGKELITQILKAGDFFGYLEIINNDNYQDNAICLTDVEVILIPKDSFIKILSNNRDLGVKFIKLIAQKKSSIEQKLIGLAYDSVREKVSEAIIQYANYLQLDSQNVVIELSREELAQIAGTAKETLIRTLSEFKNEGLIAIERKKIIIPDLNKLKQKFN